MHTRFFFLSLFAVLMIAECSSLVAQNFQTNYIKFSHSGLGSESGADYLDFDGDGNLDVLAGFKEQKHLLWMENQEVTFNIQSLADSANGHTYVKRTDFNQDGYEDFLLSLRDRNNYEKIYLFLNDSTYHYTSHFVFATGYDRVEKIEVADINSDGEMDLVVDIFANANFFFYIENLGNYQFTWSYVNFVGQPAELYGVADMDNDGFPDVVGAYYNFNINDYIVVAMETDTSLAANFIIHEIDTLDRTREGIVADFSGTSLPDLMLSPQISSTQAKLWQNNGNFSFSVAAQPIVQSSSILYLPNDYDNDNDMDVLVQGSNGIELLVNNGSANFSTRTLNIDWAGAPVAWDDVNGDGRKDLLTNGRSYIAVWTQNTNGTYQKYWANNDGGGDVLQILDADKNGQMDIFSAEGTNIRLISQTVDEKLLPTLNYTPTNMPVSYNEMRDAVQLDKDGDGDMDLIVGHLNTLYWLNNDQGTFTASVINSNLNSPRNFKMGDLDRDGNPDLIVASNTYVRLEWNGNGFSQATIQQNSPQYAFGDLDNDNDDDIIHLSWNVSAQKRELRYMKNNNNTFVDTYIQDMGNIVGNGSTSNDSRMEGADIDQDGDQDFFLLSYAEGKVVWLRNDSNLVFTDFVLTDSVIKPNELKVADMDNDQDLDIVLASANFGKVYLFTNDGNENFTETILTDEAAFPEDIQVVDFDQDGDLDILTISGPYSKLLWLENKEIDCSRTFGNDTLGICYGDSLLLGGIWRKTAGNYQDTLMNSQGCDSLLTVSLSLFSPPSTAQLSICYGDSILIGNQWVKTAGIYIDTLAGSNGCDSLHTLDLSVYTVPNIILDTTKNTVYSTTALASYAWYKNETLLIGESRDSLDASLYGGGLYYVVGRTSGGCIVYSDTLEVIIQNVGLDDGLFEGEISIYPNPVSDLLIIESQKHMSDIQLVRFFTVEGKEIDAKQYEIEIRGDRMSVNMKKLPKGFYVVSIQIGEKTLSRKLIKN